jgi:hypothetical protein
MSRWSILFCAVAATLFSTVSTGCKNGGGAENLGVFILPQNVVSISSVIPNIGTTLGGNSVTIIGSNFVPSTVGNVGSFTSAKIGGTTLINIAVPNTFTLTGTIPAGNYPAGPASVSVITSAQTATLANGYTFATMTVTAVTPNNGPITGNVAIVISGTNFFGIAPNGITLQGTGTNAGTVANLGNVVVDPSGTFISAIVPSGLPLGPYQLVIASTSFGTVNFGSLYTVGNGLSTSMLITNIVSQPGAVSPAHGPLAGGTTVVLTASIQPPATGFIPANGINVTFIFPGGQSLGATNIVVSSTVGPNDTCTFVTPAVPASFNFFGGPVTIRVDSSTQGFALATNGFGYDALTANPIINTISPAVGPQGGGTLVVIEGVNFKSGNQSNVSAVFIGGNPLLGLAVQTQNQLQGFTPAGTAGIQPVVIVGTNGSQSQTVTFQYQPSIVITKVQPNSGPVAGGNAVTVLGANFTTATILSGSLTVGGNPMTNITIVNSGTLTGVIPKGAGFGPVDVVAAPDGGLLGMTLRLAYTYGPAFALPNGNSTPVANQGKVRALAVGLVDGSICAVTANGTDNTITIVKDIGSPGSPPDQFAGPFGPFATVVLNNAALGGALNNPVDIKVANMVKGNPLPDIVVLNGGSLAAGNQSVVVIHAPLTAPAVTANVPTNTLAGFANLEAVSIDVADVNADGNFDVAVLGSNTTAGVTNGVNCFYGNGTGALSAINPKTAVAGVFAALAATDLGAVKLKIVGPEPAVIGQGGGFNFGQLSENFSTTQLDADGDGTPDIIVLSQVSATLSVLTNKSGNGTFTLVPTGSVAVGATNPVSFDVGDLTETNTLDVVTANLGASPGTGSITVMLGNGAGTFISAASYTVPNVNNPPGSNTANFSSIVVGDVNLDCRLDVVVSNFQGSELCVFLGNGDGSFAVPTDYQTETATNSLAQTANVVGLAGLIFDGTPAVITIDAQTATSAAPASYVTLVPRFDQGVAIYFGSFNSNPSFTTTTQGVEPQCVTFGDINGDGRLDMVLCNRSSNNVQVFIGDGTGNFSQPFASIPLNQNTQPSSIVIADNLVTGAFPSVLVACQGSSQVALMRNFGGGSLASPVYIPVDGTGPTQLLVQDMNADGIPDIVTVNQGSNNVSVLLGDGTGNFIRSISSPYPVGDGPVAIASTKASSPINFLATANFASDDVTVMLVTAQIPITGTIGQPGFVNGDVKFNTHEESLTGAISLSSAMSQGTTPSSIDRGRVEPVSLAIADLNGDGAPDIVTADSFTGTLTVLHGKYQGVLTLSTTAGIVAGDTLFGPPVGEASVFAGGLAVTKSPTGVQYLYHANVVAVGPGVFTPPGYPAVTLLANQVYVQDFFGGGAVLGGENPAITGSSADGTKRIPTAFFLGDALSLTAGGAAVATVQGLTQLVPSGNFFKPTDYLSIDGSAVNVGTPSVVLAVGTNPAVVRTFDSNVDGFADIVVGDQTSVLSLINQAQANLQFVTVSEVNSSTNPLLLPGLLQTFLNTPSFQIFEAFGSPPVITGGPAMVVCPAGEFTLDAADLTHYGAPTFPPSVPHSGYPINLDAVPPITGGAPAEFSQTAPGQVLSLDIGHVTLDCPPSIAVTTDGNNVTVFKLK